MISGQYETATLTTNNGATGVCNLSHARGDNLNLTGINDLITPSNNQVFAYSAANRLTSASGAYGSASWTYDGIGNRTGETLTQGGITTTDNFQYPSNSNRVDTVVRGASTIRTLTYDAAGNPRDKPEGMHRDRRTFGHDVRIHVQPA